MSKRELVEHRGEPAKMSRLLCPQDDPQTDGEAGANREAGTGGQARTDGAWAPQPEPRSNGTATGGRCVLDEGDAVGLAQRAERAIRPNEGEDGGILETSAEPEPSAKPQSSVEYGKEVASRATILRNVAMKLVRGNEALADDLVQTTLNKALANEDKFRKGTNLTAWLATILKREFINHLRTKGREHPSLDERAHIPAPVREEPEWWENITVEQVWAAVRALPSPYRETFELIYLEGLSQKVVAKRMGTTLNTVAVRNFRAKKRLRALLEERHRFVPSWVLRVPESELRAAIDATSDSLRRVLVLSFFEELPPEQIAARLDSEVETVEARVEEGWSSVLTILESRKR